MKPLIKKILRPLLAISLSVSGVAVIATAFAASKEQPTKAEAYYSPSTHYEVSDTASELASYYSTISSSDTGTSLLSKLQSLNSTKRKRTVGYSTMGTDTSGAFIYTDYALNSTATDSNGQKYGTKVASFYTKTAATGWNREHMWPNSRGGSAVEADILHTRPTISSENSSRGNSFYVEGMNTNASGWDPYTAGYEEWVRGECARVILYCVVANSSFSLSDASAISSGQSGYTSTMGDMDTLIKWHFAYTPNQYEINRNNGAEYLQGNRNPFVDHPEYVAKIWSNFNSNISSICSNNSSTYSSWTPGSCSTYGTNDGTTPSTDPYASISGTTTVTVGNTTTLTASLSNVTSSSAITWTSSSESIATVSKGTTSTSSSVATVTAVAAGTATIYCKYNGTTIGQIAVTVSASGGSGSQTEGTFTIDATSEDQITTNETSSVVFTNSPVTVTISKESSSTNANNYVAKSSQTRVYKSQKFTISASGNNIDSIVISGTGDKGVGGFTGGTWTNGTCSASGTTLTITPTNKNSDVSCAISETSSFSGVTVTLSSSGSSTTKTLSSIAVSNQKTSYSVGDTFVKPTVTATYSDSSTANVTSSATCSGYNMSTAGTQTVTVSYTEGGVTKTTTYSITVTAKTVSSLSISGTLTHPTQYIGSTFDPSGLTVTATYSDSSTADVTSSVTWSPSTLAASSTVTGSFSGKTVTVTGLTIKVDSLSSISTSGQTVSYSIGDTFSYNGICTATYESGATKTVTPTVNSSAVNMSAAGNYNVSLSYTESGVTKITSYTIQVKEVTIVNSIKECYSKSNGTSVENVYGLYVGTGDDKNPIIMNGEYGIILYNSSATAWKSWTANSTYVKVSGSISVYKSTLWEIGSYSATIITDKNEIKNNIEPISVYKVTGNETSSNPELASRLCMVSGNVASVTGTSELTVSLTVNSKNLTVYVKSNFVDDLKSYLVEGNDVTLKGFTTFYSTTFQIYAFEVVQASEDYTAEQFAQDLLDATDTICSSSTSKESDLSPVWITLEFDKYSTLPAAQKQILVGTAADNNGSTIAQAMARYDFIIAHYASLNNFIGRDVSYVGMANNFLGISQENTTAIIVVVAVLAVSSIGALVFIRRRKEN